MIGDKRRVIKVLFELKDKVIWAHMVGMFELKRKTGIFPKRKVFAYIRTYNNRKEVYVYTRHTTLWSNVGIGYWPKGIYGAQRNSVFISKRKYIT